jgi:TetR/AcrR family acrAB operon transcriptional repressor
LGNAVKRGQLPAALDLKRAAVALHGYIDGMISQWLLVPDSYDLNKDAVRWVETALDMLRLSTSLRK